MQVEARAQRCPSRLVPTRGGCADRRHALVPVGCAGQPHPARWCVSLRTLSRRAAGAGGGGCSASPGRGACGAVPGGSGLGPVPADCGGAWFDHGLAAGNGLAHGVPLPRGALPGIGRPCRDDPGGQVGSPLRRPQCAPGLFLGHAHDSVIHPHTHRRGDTPAQTPQCHPRVRRQCPALGIHAGGQQIHVGFMPVRGQQFGSHAGHQISGPAHPPGQHHRSEDISSLLLHPGTQQARDTRRACSLALTERQPPAHQYPPFPRMVLSSDQRHPRGKVTYSIHALIYDTRTGTAHHADGRHITADPKGNG